ncbi:hypothetical protein [Caballeronia arationis]|uniref:hypothetical protein n=1 Tax=Caballeronia arationis TaxID=1777142 RepID=UPI001198257B|nr:hypothetical protein [Caballeronia arationis]
MPSIDFTQLFEEIVMASVRKTAIKLASFFGGIFLPFTVLACPDCQYEFCIVGCWCMPKDQCVLPPAIKDFGKAVGDAPRLVVTTFETAVSDIGNTIHKAFDDTKNTLDIAIKDGVANITKATKDANDERGRFGRELGNTVHAIEHAVQHEAEGALDSARAAERRFREGKVVDAVWHLALSPVQVSEHSASEAVLESAYLRGVGQIAANTYGGPGGAAAYATWLAYHQTGDPSLALRVGILSGATASAYGAAGAITDTAKKAVVTGAIGGLAVAAAGGDEKAVKEAFLMAGAMVVVQDGFKEYTKHELDPRASEGTEAYCISATATHCVPLPEGAILGTDDKGNFVVDMAKVDPRIPAVGLKDNTAFFNESNPAMVGVSKIPGMQAMAIFHDTWTVDWKSDAMVKASILPAIVLTYVGTTAPVFEKLDDTAVEKSLNGTLVGQCCERPPSKTETAINAARVVDSAVSLSEEKDYTVIALERRNGPLWCSDGHIFTGGNKLIKLYSCFHKKSNGMMTDTAFNPNTDSACRVLMTHAGHTELVKNSMFDRDGCTPEFEARLNSAPPDGSTRWYRADARVSTAAQ